MNSSSPQQLTDNFCDNNLENLYEKLSSEFIKPIPSYEYDNKKEIQNLIKK